ncbi:peptide chain release factor N(5)-glutamine methyltransferase [Pelagibacteraceae bacterium]|nr:peptide chain release factor N(5)-glutamine methyltransferase [Pelagibacteraceae bacterium]
MLVSELINFGSKVLKQNKITSHLLDSELIVSNILKKSREKVLVSFEEVVSKNTIYAFQQLLKRRITKEPIAYIFREKEFWKNKFLVNEHTLIPRPETELLVEKILDNFKNRKIFILDIGIGTGCILLTLLDELKKSQGIGIDISSKAVSLAKKNLEKMKLSNRCKFYNRDLNEIFGYKFDLIVSNPPYICSSQLKNLSSDVKQFEPRLALDGGNDGLDVVRKVIYKSKDILKKKGMLALEIGFGQYKKVSQILKLAGFKKKFLVKDYQNNIRCVLAILER